MLYQVQRPGLIYLFIYLYYCDTQWLLTRKKTHQKKEKKKKRKEKSVKACPKNSSVSGGQVCSLL
jgi:hypothetical protein